MRRKSSLFKIFLIFAVLFYLCFKFIFGVDAKVTKFKNEDLIYINNSFDVSLALENLNYMFVEGEGETKQNICT